MGLRWIRSTSPTRLPASSGLRRDKLTAIAYLYRCLFLLYYCSLTMGQPREQQTCPARCRCVHVEGRLTADCSGARMASIPGPLPSGAMIVRFDNNPIGDSKWLQHSQYFVQVDRYAADWLELSLRNCNISAFRPELFWGLVNLNKLVLARNKLARIPTKPESPGPDTQDTFTPFRDMAKLRVLDLSHNQLSVLVRKNFEGAVNLEEIDLSYNDIKFVHNEAFSGLPKLRKIDLTRNKLSLVNRLTFSRLPHLKQLELSANPFDCDCRLRDFVEWQRGKYIVQPPKCMYPEKLRDKPWNHLKLDEFACAPKLIPGTGGKKAVVNVGLSTTLYCKASGIPEPKLIWEFHNATQTVVIQSTPGKYELKKTPVEGCQHYEPAPSPAPPSGCSWMHALRIVQVGPSDVGVYHCKATNPADTQYLVFQLDLDSGQIVQQQMTGSGVPHSRGYSHESQTIVKVPDDGLTTVPGLEKPNETSSSGDVLMISLILGATILVVVALLLAVLCYRRATAKNGRPGHAHGNGGAGGAQTGSGSFKPKAVNGYGYHIIDNGGAAATSPASVGMADSAATSIRSPTSPAVVGTPAINPVEKPPRTHAENFYSDEPSASGVCDYHRQQMEQQRRQCQHQPRFDDSRTGLIHAEGDDSGFSDPENCFYQQQRYATLPYQRNQQPPASGSRTPGQRVLRPAFDDPLLEKKLLLMRRNSDGGTGNGGCCVGHGHSATLDDKQRRNVSPFMANPYDKAELRETAL